jgi:hypothetical protein
MSLLVLHRGAGGIPGTSGGSGCAAIAKTEDSRDPIKVNTIPHLGEEIAPGFRVPQDKRRTSVSCKRPVEDLR